MKIGEYIEFIKQAAENSTTQSTSIAQSPRRGFGRMRGMQQGNMARPTVQQQPQPQIRQQTTTTPQPQITQKPQPAIAVNNPATQNWSSTIWNYNPGALPLPMEPTTGVRVYNPGVASSQLSPIFNMASWRRTNAPYTKKMNVVLSGDDTSYWQPGKKNYISIGGFDIPHGDYSRARADLGYTPEETQGDDYYHRSQATVWHETGHGDYETTYNRPEWTEDVYSEGRQQGYDMLDGKLNYNKMPREDQMNFDRNQQAVELTEYPSTVQQLGHIFSSPENYIQNYNARVFGPRDHLWAAYEAGPSNPLYEKAYNYFNQDLPNNQPPADPKNKKPKPELTPEQKQQQKNRNTINRNVAWSNVYPQMMQYGYMNQLPEGPISPFWLQQTAPTSEEQEVYGLDMFTQRQDIPKVNAIDPQKVQAIINDPQMTPQEKQIEFALLLKEHLPDNIYNMGMKGVNMPITRAASEVNDPRYKDARTWLENQIRGELAPLEHAETANAVPESHVDTMRRWQVDPSLDPEVHPRNMLDFNSLRELYRQLRMNKEYQKRMYSSPDPENMRGYA